MNEIDFIGYSSLHPSDFVYDVPDGHDCYLLLLIKSPSEIMVDQEIHQYPPNSAILFTPGQKIYYRACKQEYQNDWMRFHTNETCVTQFPLQNTPFSVSDPEYCHNLFMLLTWETSFTSQGSASIISYLIRVLFSKLYDGSTNTVSSVHTHALMELHKNIYNNPHLSWNVDQMAKDLHLSAGYLQSLYKKMFGTSCMDDVIEGRLRRAQDQLTYTTKPIQEIADACGYNNIEHFCRQFRQYLGCSPGQFRKSTRKDTPKELPPHNNLGGREIMLKD